MEHLLRLALLAALALSRPAFAQETTGHEPSTFAKGGTVHRVDRERRVAVIGDRLYRCAPGLQVHTAERVHGTLFHLRAGQRVRLRIAPGDARPAVVTEVWVLPAGATADGRAEH